MGKPYREEIKANFLVSKNIDKIDNKVNDEYESNSREIGQDVQQGEKSC